MSPRRRMACRLFVVGLLLGGMAGSGALAQTGSLAERIAFLEQRLTTLKTEVDKIGNNLRDAKAIIEYFNIITRDMVEYRNGISVYETNCFERKREYEAMRRDNNPFAARLLKPLQRCEEDRPGFDESVRKLSALTDTISRDVNRIKVEAERLKIEGPRYINDQIPYQVELNLRRSTQTAAEQVKNFNSARF